MEPNPKNDDLTVTKNRESSYSDVDATSTHQNHPIQKRTPKLMLVGAALVSIMGIGTMVNSSIISSMKTTLKEELHINNAEFSLVTVVGDVAVTILVIFSGLLTDCFGGPDALLWGSAINITGSIITSVAATIRSYPVLILGASIFNIGKVVAQNARYKVFSSWFPPSYGFALAVSVETGVGKIGGFLSKGTANIIASSTGNFCWTFWVATCLDVFAGILAIIIWFIARGYRKTHPVLCDPSTGEQLKEKTKKLDPRKVLSLPWTYWFIVLYNIFQSTHSLVFSQNSTELAQRRFHVPSKTAGWYAALATSGSLVIFPVFGYFLDVVGHRISLFVVCAAGTFVGAMLLHWVPTVPGTAAGYAMYSIFCSPSLVVTLDGMRTSLWHQETYGTATAVETAANAAMHIIMKVVTGMAQDEDDDTYGSVTLIYAILGALSTIVGIAMLLTSQVFVDLGRLQWTKGQRRRRGEILNARLKYFEEHGARRNKAFGTGCFVALVVLVLGGWASFVYVLVASRDALKI